MELAKIYPAGIPSEVKIPTYEEVAIEFLNARNSTATGRSWDSYKDFSKYSIIYLGKKHIDKIEKSDVIKMFDSLKKEFKDSTLKKTKTVAGMVFNYAIEKGFISKNPVKAVKKLPKSEISIKEDDNYKALTDEELENILFLSRNDKSINGMIYMLAYTGMRPGELRGLKVSDIDLEKCTVRIQRAATEENVYYSSGKRISERAYIKDTKNGDYGHRTLSVPKFVLEMALAQREHMLSGKNVKKLKTVIICSQA